MKAPAAAAAPDEARVWCPHCCALDAPAGLALEDGEIRASCGHCHGTFSLGPMRGLRAPIARLTLVSSPSRVALSQAGFSIAPSVPPVVPLSQAGFSVAPSVRPVVPEVSPQQWPHVAAELARSGSVAQAPAGPTSAAVDLHAEQSARSGSVAHAPVSPRGGAPAAAVPTSGTVEFASHAAKSGSEVHAPAKVSRRGAEVLASPFDAIPVAGDEWVAPHVVPAPASVTRASPSVAPVKSSWFELELQPDDEAEYASREAPADQPARAIAVEARDPFLVPETHCPKCVAERSAGPACTRCGLIFAQANTAHWMPPRWLSERWAAAWRDWENPTHHQLLVERAQKHDALPALARLYRLRSLWAPGDPVTEAANAELVRRASFPLVAGPRVNVASQRQRRLLVGVMALAVVLVSLGLWALRFLSVA